MLLVVEFLHWIDYRYETEQAICSYIQKGFPLQSIGCINLNLSHILVIITHFIHSNQRKKTLIISVGCESSTATSLRSQSTVETY